MMSTAILVVGSPVGRMFMSLPYRSTACEADKLEIRQSGCSLRGAYLSFVLDPTTFPTDHRFPTRSSRLSELRLVPPSRSMDERILQSQYTCTRSARKVCYSTGTTTNCSEFIYEWLFSANVGCRPIRPASASPITSDPNRRRDPAAPARRVSMIRTSTQNPQSSEVLAFPVFASPCLIPLPRILSSPSRRISTHSHAHRRRTTATSSRHRRDGPRHAHDHRSQSLSL